MTMMEPGLTPRLLQAQPFAHWEDPKASDECPSPSLRGIYHRYPVSVFSRLFRSVCIRCECATADVQGMLLS